MTICWHDGCPVVVGVGAVIGARRRGWLEDAVDDGLKVLWVRSATWEAWDREPWE